jgi:hypothetical protein
MIRLRLALPWVLHKKKGRRGFSLTHRGVAMKRGGVIVLCGLAVLVMAALVAPVGAQDVPLGDGEYTPLTYGDGVLAMLYPASWTLDEAAGGGDTLVFFSDDSMMGRPADAPYAPGEASLALTLIPTADLSRYGLPNDSLTSALTGIVSSLRASEADSTGASRLSWTLPELVPAAPGRPELAQALIGLPGEVDRRLLLWAVSNDLWALLAVSAAPGELADLAVPAQGMLQSVQLDGTVEALRSGAANQGGGS